MTDHDTSWDDAELLRRYAEAGDDPAFAEIVRRHVNLVHSAALRQVNGDAHLAADVTQTVFTDLARKAAQLAQHRVLAGWLFTSTRYAAAKAVRTERRRAAREQEAQLMQATNDDSADLDWGRVRPVLDEALGELSESDRAAILLRYFEGRDYATVGARLRVTDNTARMRVERALEKLRVLLHRRGLESTTAALAAGLGAQAVTAAPAGLAAAVAGSALAGAGAAAASFTFMSMTTLQIGLAGALVVAGGTGLALQGRANAELRGEIASLRQESSALAAARTENSRLHRLELEIADLKRDDTDTALARLNNEASELHARLQRVGAAERAQAASAKPYEVTALDRTPQARFQARPEYPAGLRTAGVTGQVVVDFIVDTEGNVQNAQAARSKLDEPATNPPLRLPEFTVADSGPAVASDNVSSLDAARQQLEKAAVEAVAKWKFDAGRKGGRDVNTHMQVPIVFTLSR